MKLPGAMSLRARLLLIAVGLLAVSLVAGNTVAIGALERQQINRIDEQLESLAELLALAPYAESVPPVRPSPALEPVVADQLTGLLGVSYIAYLLPDGTVIRDEALLGGLTAATGPELAGVDPTGVAGEVFDAGSVAGDDLWRVVVVPLQPSRETVGQEHGLPAGAGVVVAASRAEADATVAQLRRTMLVVGGVLVAVLAIVGWFAVGAGLRPLRRIEATAGAIAAGDLTQRVPQRAGPGTEVGRLSAALNGMLGQLERAFAARAESESRMRRFVADVSHELRTPLFGIRGFTELYRMGGLPERSDVDRTMGRIEREASRLAQLAEDLLLLARLDEEAAGGPPALLRAPMDLRTVAADAYHDLRGLDPSRPVTLTGPGGGPAGSAPVSADEARLRQVVVNLAGNAVAHTPAGTPVRVGVGVADGIAVLEIADQGPGMTAEVAGRVFDRFYRADNSRTREGVPAGGGGLGLSIAWSLVAAHGGRIELATAPGEGAIFRLLLPLERATPG
ncbi:HAMP domain-containing histidine kinase [Natronosporangium hydrolyticum]|uniref:histidine kinase n=1 Tax=Natronosporangium hydrolyticum TaxID=2811111 RepID=A0A895Y8Y1_9ACTN|nr:HAMP domain-containing sensor histidine kinase [Natronosporangium hydrolyticum]QSB12775.1 HAMP domain-containing histidine kinase [Natronosporangium hydrolyticum]